MISFALGGRFVAVVVEMDVNDLNLDVGVVFRLVWKPEWEAVLFVAFESNVSGKKKCLVLVGVYLVW